MGASTQEFVEQGIKILDSMLLDLQRHRDKLVRYLEELKKEDEGRVWP